MRFRNRIWYDYDWLSDNKTISDYIRLYIGKAVFTTYWMYFHPERSSHRWAIVLKSFRLTINLGNLVAENSHLAIDPIASMGLIYLLTYICHKHQPNVGKYTIDGWYGDDYPWIAIVLVKFKGWSLSTCHYVEYLGTFDSPPTLAQALPAHAGLPAQAQQAQWQAQAHAQAQAGRIDVRKWRHRRLATMENLPVSSMTIHEWRSDFNGNEISIYTVI